MNQTPDNPFYKLKVRYLFWQFVVISFAIGFVQGIVQEATREKFDSQALTLVLYVVIVISLSLWTWVDFVRAGVNLKCLIGNIPRNYKWLSALGLVLLMIIFSISAYLVSFSVISFVAPTFIESVLRQAANDPGPDISAPLFQNLLGIIVYVVVAPITEEFLFRGFILQRWAVKWGIRSALVVSSVLFGFLHANFVGLTVFGLVMGVLYIKTRSLIVPIVCHAFNNLIASGMGFLSGQAETMTTSAVNSLEQLRSGWWVGVLLMCISLPFLLRFLKRNWPQKDTRLPYLTNLHALES
ncbi:CPBP family intramembrane glutamic endopeptidase [Aliinostoc sp. HNIBRCY26]|uniref:CPBP family intramembrane glutamic endopeptidase n=1 Tax=Aliinostoc sp. HNIBRCY26 TaxID=3418997 RepID=UPI003D0754C1